MHTHAQDILFSGGSNIQPSRGVLIRMFEWQKFNFPAPRGKSEDKVYRVLRRRLAKETQWRNAMANADDLKKEMRETGVACSVCLPIEPYGSTEELLSLTSKSSSLIPFASVDPRDPQRVEKLRAYMKEGCRGLKLHPIIQDFHPEGRECLELVEEFAQYELPVLFHAGRTAYYLPESEAESYAHLDNFIKVFASFPKTRFVLGHMGMFEAGKAIEIAQVFENVYLETSFQPTRMVRRAVEKVGGDRVMFGSDWPFGGQRYSLAVALRLSNKNPWLRERLLCKNAEDLIGPVSAE
jgi:predicted TIM-barrel fold metal-dependent hydrolase